MALPNLNYKKIGLITLFVIVSLVFIYLIVRVFFLTDKQEEVTDIFVKPPQFTEPGTLPDSGPGTGLPSSDGGTTSPIRQANNDRVDDVAQGSQTYVLPVNETRVVDPTATRDGKDIAFYDPRDGYFYRLSADGENKTLLTDEKFYSVESVSWSDDKDKAVIEYPDGSNILYDFVKRSSVSLPKDVVDPAFAPVSDQIAFKLDTSNPSDNWLVISDVNGGNAQFIEPVGDRGDLVQVAFSPFEEVVALYHKPVGANQEEIFLIGQAGENYKSFVVDGLNFRGVYSPDGQRILYHVISAKNNFNPELWVVDGKGVNVGLNQFDLGLSTWIDKCTFSQNARVVYCAVPRTLDPGTGFGNTGIRFTDDVFYRVDLDTGIKKLIAEPVAESGESSFAATSIWLDKLEQNLFFWDGGSGKVYKMRIK